MYLMKDVCGLVGMEYETLRFYCNEGLVPNVKRGKNNYRCFDDRDVRWIKSLQCLRKCNMSIREMKTYMELCILGESTVIERKQMLAGKKQELERQLNDINDSMAFIDHKQDYYDRLLAGEIPYTSNLMQTETPTAS